MTISGMTIREWIARGEEMGLHLVRFYVAPDVYERIMAQTAREETTELSKIVNFVGPVGALDLYKSAHLAPGCVAPRFETPPDKVGWAIVSSNEGEEP